MNMRISIKPFIRFFGQFAAMVGIASLLAGCAGRMTNERLYQAPQRPFKNIAVSYIQDMNISGSFSARVSGLKPISSLSWDMQRDKKNAEVPVLLREAAMATDNYLFSELQKRGIQVSKSQSPESHAVLQIKPSHFLVGYNALSGFYTTRIYFEVRLTDVMASKSIWSANFYAENLLGSRPDEATARNFLQEVLARMTTIGAI